MIKKLHHIAVAVNNVEASAKIFERLLGTKPYLTEESPNGKIKIAAFMVGEAQIELLEYADPDSSAAQFLKKHGEGLLHFGLEVDDVDKELKSMENKGIKVIDRKGKKGPDGQRVGFLNPESVNGISVELVQCNT
jgi:methylmalonyl-CoA/ethylmalonyl-CoA epimerase